MDPIERMNLKFSAGAVVVSLVVASPAFSWGVAGGAVLEAVNFHGLRRSAQSLFDGGAVGGSSWVGVYGLRMVLLTRRQLIAVLGVWRQLSDAFRQPKG